MNGRNKAAQRARAQYYAALVGYFQQLGWADDELPEGINGTTWAEIVIDFEVSTGFVSSTRGE